MSLRLLLVVTVVMGIAALTVSQFVVRPHVRAIADGRHKALMDHQREKVAHTKTITTLTDAQMQLAEIEKNFDETKNQLAAATTKAREQETRVNTLDQQLTQTKQTLTGVQADLAAWNANGLRVDQVKSVIAEAQKLRWTNQALTAEVQILAALLAKKTPADNDPTDEDPALPNGLTGKVLAVDPKYDFVVLDIGATKGVAPMGTLLVSRNSKLVAKIKVSGVQEERSIANIIPGWKLAQVREGDQVIVR